MPDDTEYMTAGQFARKAGVTVRTLQYYDQQHLLSPSAKGARNQRLYTSSDEETLYKILTLKYLGLSLSEIKTQLHDCENPVLFKALVGQTMAEFQTEFQDILRRLTTLSSLFAEIDKADSQLKSSHENGKTPGLDWGSIIDLIEKGQNDNQFFWHANEDEQEVSHSVQHEAAHRADSVAQWHELIADTLFVMSKHVPPHDEQTRDIALRYQALDGSQALEQGFNIMENVVPHAHGGHDGSFDILRQSVTEYLEKVSEAHLEA